MVFHAVSGGAVINLSSFTIHFREAIGVQCCLFSLPDVTHVSDKCRGLSPRLISITPSIVLAFWVLFSIHCHGLAFTLAFGLGA